MSHKRKLTSQHIRLLYLRFEPRALVEHYPKIMVQVNQAIQTKPLSWNILTWQKWFSPEILPSKSNSSSMTRAWRLELLEHFTSKLFNDCFTWRFLSKLLSKLERFNFRPLPKRKLFDVFLLRRKSGKAWWNVDTHFRPISGRESHQTIWRHEQMDQSAPSERRRQRHLSKRA